MSTSENAGDLRNHGCLAAGITAPLLAAGTAGAAGSEIIHDHALEISKNPGKDFVIIVAHGASGKDAAVREANVQRLRAMAPGAVDKGQSVLMVTKLIGARTLQPKLRADLKGIDYTFNAKGLAQHELRRVDRRGSARSAWRSRPRTTAGRRLATARPEALPVTVAPVPAPPSG